jgi:hypothetical protein
MRPEPRARMVGNAVWRGRTCGHQHRTVGRCAALGAGPIGSRHRTRPTRPEPSPRGLRPILGKSAPRLRCVAPRIAGLRPTTPFEHAFGKERVSGTSWRAREAFLAALHPGLALGLPGGWRCAGSAFVRGRLAAAGFWLSGLPAVLSVTVARSSLAGGA